MIELELEEFKVRIFTSVYCVGDCSYVFGPARPGLTIIQSMISSPSFFAGSDKMNDAQQATPLAYLFHQSRVPPKFFFFFLHGKL